MEDERIIVEAVHIERRGHYFLVFRCNHIIPFHPLVYNWPYSYRMRKKVPDDSGTSGTRRLISTVRDKSIDTESSSNAGDENM